MNHYQLLGLRPTASREEIRAAYLRLAQELHPDRHVGTTDEGEAKTDRAKFKQIQEAYEVLYDPKKRTAYDLKHGAIPQPRGDASVNRPSPSRSPASHAYAQHGNVNGASRRGGGTTQKKSLLKYAILAVLLGLFVTAIPRCGVLVEEMRSNIEEELSNAIPIEETSSREVGANTVLRNTDIDIDNLPLEDGVADEVVEAAVMGEQRNEGLEPESVPADDSAKFSTPASSIVDMAEQAISEGYGFNETEALFFDEPMPIRSGTASWTGGAPPTNRSTINADLKSTTNHLLRQHQNKLEPYSSTPLTPRSTRPAATMPGSINFGNLPGSGLPTNGPDQTYTGTDRYQQMLPHTHQNSFEVREANGSGGYGASSYGSSTYGSSPYDSYPSTRTPTTGIGAGAGFGSGLNNRPQMGGMRSTGGTMRSGLDNFGPTSGSGGTTNGTGGYGGAMDSYRKSLAPPQF